MSGRFRDTASSKMYVLEGEFSPRQGVARRSLLADLIAARTSTTACAEQQTSLERQDRPLLASHHRRIERQHRAVAGAIERTGAILSPCCPDPASSTSTATASTSTAASGLNCSRACRPQVSAL